MIDTQLIYGSVAAVLAAAGTYAVIDAGVLDLADKAIAKAEAVAVLNEQAHLRAARALFAIEHGRQATSVDELYERGYLERVEVPEALRQ